MYLWCDKIDILTDSLSLSLSFYTNFLFPIPQEDRRRNESYLKNISEYPEGLESVKRDKRRKNRSGRYSGVYGDDEDDMMMYGAGSKSHGMLPSMDPEYRRDSAERSAKWTGDSDASYPEASRGKKRTLKPLY